ncbi:hypothetical protein VB779_08650 [Haloarculaceae archaeon H-GB11]|nr:hypothetical protein [Haloarculaceae archaeon H-GB11]
MTRTTVYRGRPDDHDDEPLADVFHDHEYRHAVVIETTGGQKIKIREDEAVDIYIDGEEVEE